jgi:hypothetical protein
LIDGQGRIAITTAIALEGTNQGSRIEALGFQQEQVGMTGMDTEG